MKKVVLVLLVMLCLVSMTGCGKKNKEGAQKSDGQVTTNSNGEGAAEELKHVTLKLTYPGTTQKDEAMVEEKINAYIKDKINASIDIDPIPWSSFHDKTNLMMATGDQLDMVFTATWYEYNGSVAKKAYLPLDDLIDQYAPKTKALLHPALLEGPKVGGVLYALPTNKEIASAESIMFRKDLLDKYDFELPVMIRPEDFKEVLEPMLQTIKENEKNIYPLFITGENSIARPYATEMVTIGDGAAPGYYDIKTGQVVYFQESEHMKSLYALMHNWYNKGYINEDCLTAETTPNNIFCTWQPYKPGKDKEMSAQLGAEFVIVPSSEPVVTTGSVTGSMLAISRATVDAERCMMFLELLNTDKYLNNLLNYGIEDVHYVKIDDNTIDFPEQIDSTTSTYYPASQWMFQNQFLNYLRKGEDPEKWKKFEAFNNSAQVSPLLGFAFDASSVKTEIAACSNVYSEYEAALKAGVLSPEDSLPKYMEKLKANGSEAILAEKQRQVDHFMENRK